LLKILKEQDEEKGHIMWTSIANHLKGRTNRQCRDRWFYHLRPDLKKKGDWSYEEDEIIIEKHNIYGN